MGKLYKKPTTEERAVIIEMTANNCSVRQSFVRLHRAHSAITRDWRALRHFARSTCVADQHPCHT